MPKLSSVDRAFARYQRTGHPAWLAAVFDATASELLQLAGHLSADRHAAEDLVQSTFLTAIEQRATFDPTQPVLPWLCGILANRARTLRRQRAIAARHAEHLPRRDDVHDAAADAAAGELRSEVLAALRSLPEPYRQVLLLHLHHGLDGREIGDALQRPAATVRSQIHRGFAMLRRALPIGIAGAASAMSPPVSPAGLARVREAVLAVTTPPAWLPWVLAFAIMHKAAITTAVALAALSLLALAVWPATAPAVARDSEPRATTVASSTSAVSGPPTAELEPAGAGRSAASSAAASLTITVVQKNGEPLADVGLSWTPLVDRGTLAAQDLRSDRVGRARFVDLPAGRCIVRSDRGGDVKVDVSVGGTHEAVLRLPGERTVLGIVVDEHDRPVAAAEVWLLSPFRGGARLATTGDDGTFSAKALPTGQMLAAWAPGRCSEQPQSLTDKHPEPWSCRLVVTPRGGDLSGTVTDQHGQPVAGAIVYLDTPRGADLARDRWAVGVCDRQLRADPQGRFRFLGATRGTRQLWCGAPEFAASAVQVAHGDGPTDVTVVLAAGATVRGTVRHEDGSPAAGVFVRQIEGARRYRHTSDPHWSRGESPVSVDGTFVLSRLTPGEVALQVQRQDERRCMIELVLAEGEQAQWHPQFGRQPRFHGIVVDPDGQPLSGYRVRTEDGQGVGTTEARTESNGEFGFDVSGHPLRVDVMSPRHEHIVWRRRRVQPSDEPLRIVIPAHQFATATIVGTLLAADDTAVPEGNIELRWLRDDGGIERGGTAEVRDGRFRAEALRPGRYHLIARAKSHGTLHAGPFAVEPGATVDIGALRFAVPGRVRVRVLAADGSSPAGPGMLVLRRSDSPEALGVGSRDGVADLGQLAPGRWFVSTWGHEVAATLTVDVSPGDDREITLHLPNGVPCLVRYPAIPCDRLELRCTWRNERGELAFESCGNNDEGDGFELPLRIAPGRYTITVTDGADRTATTTAEVRDTHPPSVVVLPLPGAARR